MKMGCSISADKKRKSGEEECFPMEHDLNPTDIRLIRQTWLNLQHDLKNIGKDLFLRYFEQNPSYQSLFPEFRNLTRSQMEQSRSVLGHGKRVMKAIENAVATLQDHEVLESYFVDLGQRHATRKLKAHHLNDMRRAFIDVIRDRLKDIWTKEVAIAWNKFFCRISNDMLKSQRSETK